MSAPKLHALQQQVQRHLLDPQFDPGALIADTDKVPRAVRLFFYANAYRARLVEAMSADFSALHGYLGDDEFERLIHAYVEVFPSRNFSVRPFGRQLPEFLRTTAPYAEHSELYELALFEWALCDAFDAADALSVDMAQLAALDPDAWAELKLEFHPSLQIVELYGNAPALWSALNAEQQPPELQFADTAQSWLVWRQDLKLLFRGLDVAELKALAEFRSEGNFSAVCELLTEYFDEDDVPLRALGFLQQWLREGLVTGIGVS